MPLIEHIRELRDRLFRACLGLVAGMVVGLVVAEPVQGFLNAPYCARFGEGDCLSNFNAVSPLDPLLLKIKIAFYVGLIVSSPVWLYQLWAFITPGLHRNEKRWTFVFAGIGTPLFVGGAWLAHLVVARGLPYLLPGGINVDIRGYFDFVTGMLLIFGVGFEFPLVVFMLNAAGVVSARRLLGWWRTAVFLIFAFAAVATADPSAIGMIVLALAMTLLYFAAVGAAFLNDRRRARIAARSGYAGLSDDEASPLDGHLDEIAPPDPVEPPLPVEHSTGDAER